MEDIFYKIERELNLNLLMLLLHKDFLDEQIFVLFFKHGICLHDHLYKYSFLYFDSFVQIKSWYI